MKNLKYYLSFLSPFALSLCFAPPSFATSVYDNIIHTTDKLTVFSQYNSSSCSVDLSTSWASYLTKDNKTTFKNAIDNNGTWFVGTRHASSGSTWSQDDVYIYWTESSSSKLVAEFSSSSNGALNQLVLKTNDGSSFHMAVIKNNALGYFSGKDVCFTDVYTTGTVNGPIGVANNSLGDAEKDTQFIFNGQFIQPSGYSGSFIPDSYNPFTPPQFNLHYEVDDKHVKVTNSSSGILDTPEGSPDIACSLKAIQGFDAFPTVYESNTTYCSSIFEFDVQSYGKYNIALKYWHFTGSRADGISADDYYFLGEATTNIFINGTKFSGSADSIGSTEICDSLGNCRPTDGSYMPCLAWGEPIVQTDLTQPALINPISCFSDFGSFVNSLSFGAVNLGNFQDNPNQCRELVIIDDWIHKPDITLCAKVPSYVRDVLTPIVTMVLSIFILTWLVNRGDRYGV